MTNGVINIPINEKVMEAIIEITKSWVEYLLQSLEFPDPISCDSREVPAIEIPDPIDINKNSIGHINDVAANCTEPIILTQNPSARL